VASARRKIAPALATVALRVGDETTCSSARLTIHSGLKKHGRQTSILLNMDVLPLWWIGGRGIYDAYNNIAVLYESRSLARFDRCSQLS
jgi:hypothetical protein